MFSNAAMRAMDTHKQELDRHGFTLLPNRMSAALLAGLRERVEQLFITEGDSAGSEFKQERGARRLANLVNKGEVFWPVVTDSTVLALVRHVLSDSVKLSSLNARSAEPHNSPQPLHCDMGAVADDLGFWVCNAVWMLDAFTRDNGALRVIPGSHRWRQLPQETLADPAALRPDEVIVTGEEGSVIVMNAHLWHGGMANRTNCPRTAVHAFYCRRDKPQQQYQRQLLSTDVQARLPRDLRDLLALDDPSNDALSLSPPLRSGFLK